MSDTLNCRPLADGYLVTPAGRLSFPHLFKPNAPFNGQGKPKYEATILLPPESDVKTLQKLLVDAYKAKFGKAPKRLSKPPLKKVEDVLTADGDLRYPDFEGWYVLTARTTRQPSVVDRLTKPIVPETDAGGDVTNNHPQVYPGAWAMLIINAFGWNRPDTGPNVSFGLSAVQIVKDDERIGGGGGSTLANQFEAHESEDGDTTATADDTEEASDTDAILGL